ncbi:MAG: Type 1 glutamine amidotransferase-like domain-containing protein [Clostridia bacterium]|nr:Type 1 glutamine amidotransferase-like domain-containing protein [Clostridia bacterium]
MNLLLTSCGLETDTIQQIFVNMLNKPMDQVHALFIPTAANSPDAIDVLPKCLEDLLRCGIPRENILVYDLYDRISDEQMQELDAVYLCGGSPSYLLRRINEGGFRATLLRYIGKNGVVLGVSAGSMVFASQMENNLGLLHCPLHVHCPDEKRIAPGRYPLSRTEDIMLGNRQGIVFDGNDMIVFE